MTRRPTPTRRQRPRGDHNVASHPHAIDLSAEKADRPKRARGKPSAGRDHQPAQRAARRDQSRRLDAVDRLRRHRREAGAGGFARGVVMERPRSGDDLPARSPGADVQRRRWSSRRASMPISTSRTSNRSTAQPGSSSWRASSPTNGPGPRNRFTHCRSRKSSSGMSASKAGITSANGRVQICAASSNALAPI